MKKHHLLILLSLISLNCASWFMSSNSDIQKVNIITSDIDLFWTAFDEFERTGNASVFKTEYFDKGSKGLHDFVDLRINSADELAKKITATKKYYLSIRQSSLNIKNKIPSLNSDFENLRKLYPKAVFPDVYFVMGKLSTGGTTSTNGLLIGAEMYSKTDGSPENELNNWEKRVLKNESGISAVVSHELIHYQQKDVGIWNYIFSSSTLLDRCLHEGIADFVGEKISAGNINSESVYTWAQPREKELWLEFKQEKDGKDYSKWLYNGTLKDRPADVGYFMGYKIAEAYYENASDKKQAIADMLESTDSNDFLEKSGYAKKFEN